MADRAPDERRTLRGQVSAGVAWGIYITIFTQVSRMAVAIVLARLLTPADYGLAAMAFVCTSFVLSLSDASLGQALVQRATIDELDRSTVFWTTFAIGIALTIIGFLTSGLVADLFHDPAVQPLVAVLSLSFVLSSLQMTQASLFQREMLFKLTALRFTVAVIVSSIVGLTAALLGAGAWALIAQQIAFTASSTVALWMASPWRPRFIFSWTRLRRLGGFGLNVMGSRLLGDVSTNADTFLVARYLGSAAVGVYSVAFNLMTLPIARLILPIQDSLFPAYARIQEDKARVARIWHRTNAVTVALVAPAMVGLAVLAPEFVNVVLGSRWAAAAPVLRILAPVAIGQSLISLSNTLLLGIDRSTTVFRLSLTYTTLVVVGFVLGVHWGLTGIAVALAIAMYVVTAADLYVTAVALGAPVRDVLRSLSGPIEATAVMALALFGAKWALSPYELPTWLELIALVAVGGLVYVPACLLRVAPVRAELGRVRRLRPALRVVEATPFVAARESRGAAGAQDVQVA
jgi:O-antigen/teichoic acid export membrane protein